MSLEGEFWEAEEEKLYGTGAGCAHPSVEWVACPLCGAPAGHLCRDDDGNPKLTRHASRCSAFREIKRLWVSAGLEPSPHCSPGRRRRTELLREWAHKRRKPR